MPFYRTVRSEAAKEDFIREFISDDDNADANDFLKISYQKKVGSIISASNYVGLVQTHSGNQVEILPKIDFATCVDGGPAETKRVFLRMLCSMKDFPCKVFNDANLDLNRMTLYEAFINMYLQEAWTLVKHGIKSAYVRQEDNLNVFKGKLIVKEQIKKNMAHAERFYVAYDDYTVNRPENRIIKATLLKLQRISTHAKNQKEIRMLLTAFESVSPSTNYQGDFSKAVVDRLTQEYEIILHWSKVFLLDKSFTTFSGTSKARALLFPMEKVFEAYVAQELKKVVWDLNWVVYTQDTGKLLFDDPPRFALRPDIVISRDDGTIILLDTKWKRLENKPGRDYGISQSDMYQMYAYSKKYKTSEIWLLYPLNSEMRDCPEIKYRTDDDVIVRLFFVDVANIEKSLEKLKANLCTR